MTSRSRKEPAVECTTAATSLLTRRGNPKGTIACRQSHKSDSRKSATEWQGQTDKAKARLLETQFPVGVWATLSNSYCNESLMYLDSEIVQGSTPPGTGIMQSHNGTNGSPKSVTKKHVRNTGLPKGREPYGNGATVVVVGDSFAKRSPPHQGGWESQPQGEG